MDSTPDRMIFELSLVQYQIRAETRLHDISIAWLHTFCSPGLAIVARVPTIPLRSHIQQAFSLLGGEKHLEIKLSHKFVYKMRRFKHVCFQILNNKH
jgi:hypothetical protein